MDGYLWRIAFIMSLFFLIAPPTARSQSSVSDVVVDKSAQCPSETVLRAFPGVTLPTAGIGSTVVKLGNDTHLAQSTTEQSGQTYVLAPFNTQLIVYGFNSAKTKLFVRLRPEKATKASPGHCGWISVDRILLPRDKQFTRQKQPQPLQMRDISGRDSGNLLNVKAVIHNISITGDKPGIDAFADPANTRETDKIDVIKMFDTYPVFAEANIPPTEPQGETRYWLIGAQNDDGTTDLKGWVRSRDVVIWPSRLAVQWNEGTTISGFATVAHLEHGQNAIIPAQVLDQVDYPDKITRRMPVLDQMPKPEYLLSKLPVGAPHEERRAIALKNIEYYWVAAPGRACKRGDSTDCLTAQDTDAAREKLVKAAKAARRMDVLILIDATESMDPYFSSTVNALQHFVKKATEVSEIDIRFGISLYGDYTTNTSSTATVAYREIVPFFHPLPANVDEKLRPLLADPKSLIFKDIHLDKLEAPFAALIRASNQKSWRSRQDVPLRFIIHLADDGNRARGKTSTETMAALYPNETKGSGKSTLREAYDEKDVVSAFDANGIIYVPVAVLGGKNEGGAIAVWNRIFLDQAKQILTLMGDRSPTKQVETTYSEESIETLERRVIATVAAIFAAIETAFRVEDMIQYQAECTPETKSARCRRRAEQIERYPAYVKLADRVASEAAGLSADELRRIYSREQSIVTAYVPARSKQGKETLTHWVALDRREFTMLRQLLSSLCEAMGTQDAQNPVLRALRQFTELAANEDFTGLTVGEILGKRLGIPNLERTDFSSRTRDEVDDAFRAWQIGVEPQTWLNWHQRACKAAFFTQLMNDNKKVNPDAITCDLKTKRCSVPEKERRDFRWALEISKAEPVYYVPLDVLP